jgi:hypothetical protein
VAAPVAISLDAASATASGPLTPAQARQVATDAYVYGIPLMEFLRTAKEQTSVARPDAESDAPLNRFGSARRLATPSNHVIVQPNNDTLYTMAHVDLSGGPLVLHVPAAARHRYYSFEFMDPYTNVFAYIGTRTTGDGPGTFLVTGPSFHGAVPREMRRIRSPYARAWIVGRTLVLGPYDLAAAHRVQNGYRLLPLSQYLRHGLNWMPPPPRRVIRKPLKLNEPRGLAFFDALGTALAQNRPPARDATILRELRTVGVGPGLHPSREHLSTTVLTALQTAADQGPSYVESLRTKVATKSVAATSGWFVPPPDTGDYGTNYSWRAVVALAGLAANRPAEAMYIVGATDSKLAFLNGADRYVVRFPGGQLPPARYFWSLTMYNQSFYLVPNPLHRYEIGNRTPGLKYDHDGALDIYIQHAPPAGHRSNWLPAPATGNFEVTLRLYGPLPTALKRTYRYPPITRVG